MKFLLYTNKIIIKILMIFSKNLWRKPIDLTDNPQIKELFPNETFCQIY